MNPSPPESDDHHEETPYASPLSDANEGASSKLSLPLFVGLLTLVILAFWLNIGVGIGVLLISIPAYARAAGVTSQQAHSGHVSSTSERIVAFLGSIGVVLACCVAGGIAFFATCTASLFFVSPLEQTFGGGAGIWFLVGASCLGFLAAAALVYNVCWPRRKRPTP